MVVAHRSKSPGLVRASPLGRLDRVRDTARAMSRETVEVVQRLWDAWNEGRVEEGFALIDPDVRWTTAADEPDPQTYVGHEGLRRLLASWADMWQEGGTSQPTEFIEHGGVVIVPTRFHVRGRTSGVDIDSEETYVVRVCDGKIMRVQEYRTKDEALQALQAAE